MNNLGQMLKQAQEMQARMADMQADMERREVSGGAGAGMLELTLNGKGQMRRVKIDPALMQSSNAEMLQDLIVAAHNDAKSKLDEIQAEEMSKLTGGLPLPPGFKMPFG